MKILLTGPGMLGRDVLAALGGAHEITALDIHELDITDAGAVQDAAERLRPRAVINCAAATNVDGCEADPEGAFAVNAQGVKNLALACKRTGAALVHISTDYVFDGAAERPYREGDPTNPLSVYGRSKLAGERHVQELLEDYAIIRTEWLYGIGGRHFVGRILELAAERDFLEVVDDQVGSPTWTADLARAVAALVTAGARGMYHVTNAGACSWYELARRALKLAGSSVPVRPISSQRLARPAPRPANSVLDCSKFTRATGHALRPWEEALEQYMLQAGLLQGAQRLPAAGA